MSDREKNGYGLDDLDDILAEFHAQERAAAAPKAPPAKPAAAAPAHKPADTGETAVFRPSGTKKGPAKGAQGISYEDLPKIHAEAPAPRASSRTPVRTPPGPSPEEQKRRRRARLAAYRRSVFLILLLLALALGGTLWYFQTQKSTVQAPQSIQLRLNEFAEDCSRQLLGSP